MSSMYGDRAAYYDLLYQGKNYAEEAEFLHQRILTAGIPDGAVLLDGGCGTGLHLQQFSRWYRPQGFDLSPEMVELARKRIPAAKLWSDNLASFQVSEPVDVAVSLFSAIGYLLDETQLRASADSFFRALRPGGLLILEPWLSPDLFRAGRPFAQQYMDADIALSRVSVSALEGEISLLKMAWTVVKRGSLEIEHFVEEQRLWLCPHPLFLQIFRDAGFEAEMEQPGLGRGLLIGRRPLNPSAA